ncbi:MULTISPECIES: thiamine pyrophosphate-binding protein [Streptomycetaceae]|uniref:thiamine pyrophosphate-binding protein n=1 Tax=Embleya scabrispora TaxID=159449 RepID=UPI00035E0C65|nr:hypothetical protein [Streptomyces sp. SID5474]
MAPRRVPVMNAVVEVLKSEGVDTAFGCPGAAILPLYAALEAVGGIEHPMPPGDADPITGVAPASPGGRRPRRSLRERRPRS